MVPSWFGIYSSISIEGLRYANLQFLLMHVIAVEVEVTEDFDDVSQGLVHR